MPLLSIKNNTLIKDHWSNWSPYASTLFATAQGASLGSFIGGPFGFIMGGALGFSTNLLDEMLIANNFYNKHYLGNIFFWSTAISASSYIEIIKPPPLITVAVSTAISYYHEDLLDFSNKVDIPMESLIALRKFLNYDSLPTQNTLTNLYKDEYLFSVLMEHALNIFKIIFDTYVDFTLGVYNSKHYIIPFIQKLLSTNKEAQDSFYQSLYKTIGLHTAKEAFDIAIKDRQHAISEKQSRLILNKSSIFQTSEEARKLVSINRQEGEIITKSLVGDLYTLKKETSLLDHEIKHSLEFISAAHIALRIYPNIFVLYLTINLFNQHILKYKNKELKLHNEDRQLYQSQAENTLYDIVNNQESIILRDGSEFMTHKMNKDLFDLKTSQSHINNDYLFRKIIDTVSSFFKCLIEMGMIEALLLEKLTIDQFALIIKDINPKRNSFVNSNIEAQKNNIKSLKALSNLNRIFKSIDTKTVKASRHATLEDKIIIKNYSLYLKDQELVKIGYLEFEKGYVYALTGESGSGKTSMLIDLYKGVVGALKSYGEIYVPDKLRFFFIDQKVFLPKGLTLKEIIYFPKIITSITKDEIDILDTKILDLLGEFEVFSIPINANSRDFLLEKLDNKDFKLSGGQTKKIAIIQAIIYHPEILIMDETFEGLDKKILRKIQFSIKKYLPDTTIIVVDHHLEANNDNNFYDLEINFVYYKFLLLIDNSLHLSPEEIGLFFEEDKLFCRTHKNERIFEIQVSNKNSFGISIDLYKKLKNLSNDIDYSSVSFITLDLEQNDKHQIKNALSQHGNIVNNTWVELHNLSPDNNLLHNSHLSLEENNISYNFETEKIESQSFQPTCVCLGDSKCDLP